MRRAYGWAGVLGLVLLTACADDPVGVTEEAPDYEIASYDVFGDGYGFSDGGRRLPGVPVLGRLLVEARIRLVAEQGEEAARAAFALVAQLRIEAAAARQAGDRELFREKVAALHAEAGRLVVEILGASRATELVELATERLRALDAVIANRVGAGVDVTRLRVARRHAAELLAAAESALAAGDVLGALLNGARSAQISTVAAHHGRTLRPGTN